MNLVILMGRLTGDPEIINTDSTKIAKYSLAIDRATKEKQTDFIPCTAFGKNAEFVESYLKKGTKITIEGRLQSGSYEKDGRKVKTYEVVVSRHEFCEKAEKTNGFANATDEGLPF